MKRPDKTARKLARRRRSACWRSCGRGTGGRRGTAFYFTRGADMATKAVETNGRLAEHFDEAPATMKPEIVTFTIVGISPLLQNNPANFIGKAEGDELVGKKKEYDDAEEAKLRIYLDPDGQHCHPCEAFTKAMVKAVAGKKFGKMFATAAIKGSVFITEPFAVLVDEKGKPAKGYTIDRRPVVVGKARVLRCRPCFSKWRVRLALEIDTAILTPAQVKESLALAGRIIGVGDYRPEKGGGFGRFRVE
jgi:hypothetical protein